MSPAISPTKFVMGATVDTTRTGRPLTSVPAMQSAPASLESVAPPRSEPPDQWDEDPAPLVLRWETGVPQLQDLPNHPFRHVRVSPVEPVRHRLCSARGRRACCERQFSRAAGAAGGLRSPALENPGPRTQRVAHPYPLAGVVPCGIRGSFSKNPGERWASVRAGTAAAFRIPVPDWSLAASAA